MEAETVTATTVDTQQENGPKTPGGDTGKESTPLGFA